MKRVCLFSAIGVIACLAMTVQVQAGVQYSNDFDNPSSTNVTESWPEWVMDSSSGFCEAVNGRIEWDASGGNNDWLRLNQEVPANFTFEFDLFLQEDRNGRFSVWPFCNEGDTYTRYNYFVRKNTHYFNGADTVPSEGSFDATLPLGANPHRMRMEVTGNHVLFLYKNQGVGGWILIDEHDFPAIDEPRYIMLGHNSDDGVDGLWYVDNLVLSYSSQDLMTYNNNFDNASSTNVTSSWPEWVMDSSSGFCEAVNGRIEWDASGGNNDWLRLNMEVPENYVYEFDLFLQEDRNGRFSVWPFCNEGDTYTRYNYFVRKNTHYFNGADTVPSEGSFDATLPLGANPHRMRVEVTGNHVLFLYKNQGEGGWILIDEHDFPAIDSPRYVMLGHNSDDGAAGLWYVDNFVLTELASNRAVVARSIGAEVFSANTPVPVSLSVTSVGNIPSLTVVEGLPENWGVANISHGGVVSGGNIIWSFTNQSEALTLTYDAIPPRLILTRVAGFSGSVDSGDGEERIAGDTAISIQLPYLYRECIDYDFSGSPVDGKNYPTEHAFGERYTQGMDGIPSDTAYERPGGGGTPAIDAEFVFPAGEDFRYASPTGGRGGSYAFDDYRDQGEIVLEHGSSDTNAGIGSDTISTGDWFRYTFDLGEGDQVLLINLSINTWGGGASTIDVYIDNKFKGEIAVPDIDHNAFYFQTIGPFEVPGGVHSIVLAIPGDAPDGLGRMEVVRVEGIGRVERTLTADGFFEAGQPLTVSLTAESLYGTYTSFIDEVIPPGVEVTDLGGGQLEGNHLLLTLDPTATSQTVTYQINTPEGLKFLLFNGFCDVGLPLAEPVRGDTSVTNEAWLFGTPVSEDRDDFDGNDISDPWVVEYGSDPALNTNYEDGVDILVSDSQLGMTVDTVSMAGKFDEWANGRRAPMILRTDIPEGDWRIETDVELMDTFTWAEYHFGLTVTYNDGQDTNVSGDEYLFGFYAQDIHVELTNKSALGTLSYHEFTDELDWVDSMLSGNINAKLAVTRRGGELIFSAQLPGRSWQLVGPPISENREPTRIGLFSKIWGSDNYTTVGFDYFTLSTLDEFTDVKAWMLF